MPTVGAQPQQLCDKTHTHFNWNGVNKIKTKNKEKTMQKKRKRKYFRRKNASTIEKLG